MILKNKKQKHKRDSESDLPEQVGAAEFFVALSG